MSVSGRNARDVTLVLARVDPGVVVISDLLLSVVVSGDVVSANGPMSH